MAPVNRQPNRRKIRNIPRRIAHAGIRIRFPIPFSRWIQVLLGLVFLFAAGAKGFDIVRFGRQIEAIIATTGIVRSPLLEASALTVAVIVIIIELLLGSSLFTGFKSTDTSLYALITLIGFSCVAVWVIMKGDNLDCGCFGPVVSRSARQTLASDVLLVVMALIGSMSKFVSDKRRITSRLIVIFGIVGTIWFYFVPSANAALRIGSELSRGKLVGFGIDPAIRYLWLFNPDCSTCQKLTPSMNAIAASSPGRFAGISSVSRGRIQEFEYDFKTDFPIRELPVEKFNNFGLQEGTLVRVSDMTVDRIWSPYQLKVIIPARMR